MIRKIYRTNITATSDRKSNISVIPDVWIRGVRLAQEIPEQIIIDFGVMMERDISWCAPDVNVYERREVFFYLHDRPEQTMVIAGLKIYDATKGLHKSDRVRITARIMHMIAPDVHEIPHAYAKPPAEDAIFCEARSWTRRALGLKPLARPAGEKSEMRSESENGCKSNIWPKALDRRRAAATCRALPGRCCHQRNQRATRAEHVRHQPPAVDPAPAGGG